jgi:hypothetical protein
MVSKVIYITHTLFVRDINSFADLEWTDQHVLQGFARTSDCVNFAFDFETATMPVSVRKEPVALDESIVRAVSVSLYSASARLRVDSVGDSIEHALIIELPAKGWYRVTLAQREYKEDEDLVEAYLFVMPEPGERPSEILIDKNVPEDLVVVETAERTP